ncbi:MAG: CHRD domain-containing protein [Jaaginema sp. PMC 1080.18]|nr:CHRD domain-containing protein [Jaaginema sp. PMC 1080.18]
MKHKVQKMKYTLGFIVFLLGVALPYSVKAGHTNIVLTAELDGSAEVPSSGSPEDMVGDPTGMGEGYVFGIDNDPSTLCYTLEVSRIQMVPVGEGMAAHIHEGAMGENGPVVAVLAGPEDGNAADCLTEGEEGKFPTGEAGIVQRILNNPEDFYINVHNPQFPNGAIRGQLKGHSHSH